MKYTDWDILREFGAHCRAALAMPAKTEAEKQAALEFLKPHKVEAQRKLTEIMGHTAAVADDLLKSVYLAEKAVFQVKT